MKFIKNMFLYSCLLMLTMLLASCITENQSQEEASSLAKNQSEPIEQEQQAQMPSQDILPTLPVKYQTASYVVDREDRADDNLKKESTLKVGAKITSTRGPQPLWDIMKRLAAMKGMNVSWASDVDQKALVDVDIRADDDFYEAIDSLLRQIDYFHEMEGNTIIIKYKETRRFQIAMPFTKQTYSTGTGGNLLGSKETSNNVDGTIELKSIENEFDIWDNIKLNIESIMEIWSFRRERAMADAAAIDAGGGADGARTYSGGKDTSSQNSNSSDSTSNTESGDDNAVTGGLGYYLIDKPVGLITVTAPRIILDKIEAYITTLKKSLYQQINIEAKIIEVQLSDSSSIGINWSKVLKNFAVSGSVEFGTGGALGQIYPFVFNNDEVNGERTYIGEDRGAYSKTINPGQFVSKISLASASFDVFLNALNEQGDTKVLSNPKISVMNGQPALITVGRNITYINEVTSDLDSDTGVITYSVETERILSGIGMAITATVLDDDQIIMNLVPITSELEEPIFYKGFGTAGAEVGLPVVNVREMSTTVKVKSGEMLVIGGLISETTQNKGEFAPLLGDIPLVKYLFGWEEKVALKRELIILLRPRIM